VAHDHTDEKDDHDRSEDQCGFEVSWQVHASLFGSGGREIAPARDCAYFTTGGVSKL
jgi:hypothetical protein